MKENQRASLPEILPMDGAFGLRNAEKYASQLKYLIAEWDDNLCDPLTLVEDEAGNLRTVRGHHRREGRWGHALQNGEDPTACTLPYNLVEPGDEPSGMTFEEYLEKLLTKERHRPNTRSDVFFMTSPGGVWAQALKEVGLAPKSRRTSVNALAIPDLVDVHFWNLDLEAQVAAGTYAATALKNVLEGQHNPNRQVDLTEAKDTLQIIADFDEHVCSRVGRSASKFFRGRYPLMSIVGMARDARSLERQEALERLFDRFANPAKRFQFQAPNSNPLEVIGGMLAHANHGLKDPARFHQSIAGLKSLGLTSWTYDASVGHQVVL